MDKANVRVLEETADRLHDRKARGETYDDVIQRLLDAVEGEQELIADGGVSVEAADEDDDLDDWISKNLVGVSGRKRERLLQTEKDRRAAVERADQAEAEARRLRRQNRQLEARPSTSLEIGGQQLGPLGTTAAGVAVFLAGVGVGVGVE